MSDWQIIDFLSRIGVLLVRIFQKLTFVSIYVEIQTHSPIARGFQSPIKVSVHKRYSLMACLNWKSFFLLLESESWKCKLS